MYVSPGAASATEGGLVTVFVNTSSADQALNAVSGQLSFPTDKLEVVSISKTGSLIAFWMPEPAFSNIAGTVSFDGVVPNPGYTGGAGRVLGVTFRAKSAGDAYISFAQASVLANDGQGSEILTGSSGASVSIAASAAPVAAPAATKTVAITSSTHPKEDSWYNSNTPAFSWSLPTGAVEVRTLIGENAAGQPSVAYAPPISSKTIEEMPDGTYYFSLQVRTAEGWSAVARYRINIDTVAPNAFEVAVAPDASGKPVAEFTTTDDLSGIARYELLVNGARVGEVSAAEAGEPVMVPETAAGQSTLTVVAYDKAGNKTSASAEFMAVGTDPAAPAPAFSFAFSIPYETLATIAWLVVNYLSATLLVVGVVGGIIFAAWYAWHRVHGVRRKLIRRLAATDHALHGELIEIHKALAEEVERLAAEGKARELTAEEKRIQKKFARLVGKTKAALGEHYINER